MRTSLFILLVAGAFASPNMRNVLSQQKAKQLAEVSNAGKGDLWNDCDMDLGQVPEPELHDCECKLHDLPGLGAGTNTGYHAEALAAQGSLLTTVPDTQYSQICQSNCCSCEQEAHTSQEKEGKNRTFVISGSISVFETLRLQSCGNSREKSQGQSQKETVCQTNNYSPNLAAPNQCLDVSVKPVQGVCSTNGIKAVGTAL
ncbi:UNKNOWN [Stylonychia lemnae]|uniref:Uncharacterized protein n=1 Tax=Stylonychia lemnae TaxID=5949 RepID=A0A078A098_STYLE|nr:UNKNOWN [Stylonychia lemnae]|eukprot:CDW74208.1 UNKNOWN [Stylonychia lemnae]